MNTGQPADIISIRFTESDARQIAARYGIAQDIALDRAASWGSYIQDMLSALCAEQLESCIRFDQP